MIRFSRLVVSLQSVTLAGSLSVLPFVLMLALQIATLSQVGQTQEVKRAADSAKGSKSTPSQLARGKYLVEGVAICGQCHTPRDSGGAIDSDRRLEGAPLWLLPARPTADWPLKVPRIAGTPAASDPDLITLLTTGIWHDGKPLRPPMPQFHMTREDAEAVVTYLRSLSSGPGE